MSRRVYLNGDTLVVCAKHIGGVFFDQKQRTLFSVIFGMGPPKGGGACGVRVVFVTEAAYAAGTGVDEVWGVCGMVGG